jgi:hypothetical protein
MRMGALALGDAAQAALGQIPAGREARFSRYWQADMSMARDQSQRMQSSAVKIAMRCSAPPPRVEEACRAGRAGRDIRLRPRRRDSSLRLDWRAAGANLQGMVSSPSRRRVFQPGCLIAGN